MSVCLYVCQSLMMEAKTISELLKSNSMFTLLVIQEDFITCGCRESFRFYVIIKKASMSVIAL
jgi:hypothetical protein